ncbi:MAG: ABC transporter ATP-binding protein, partial [Anaerolineales bacterium]|nr:ABC transporter ATP-binding protein [Anaerolineales bacterium]
MTARQISMEFSLPERFRSNRSSAARWLLSHTVRYWYLILVMLIGAFSNAGLAALAPIYIGEALDVVLGGVSVSQSLLRLALLIAGTQVLRAVLQLLRNFGAEMIGQRIERDVRDELYVSLLGKSMTFHSLQPVGDTMARATNDVREVNLMFSPGLNLVIGSANFLIMPLVMAPRYHPSLMLVPAIYIILYILSLWQYLHELQPITTRVRQAFGRLNTRLAEALDGIETVKGMAQELREVDLFGQNARRFRDRYVHQGDVEARFIPYLLLALATAGGLLHAFILYRQGFLAVGDVAGYFGLLTLLSFPTFVSLFAYSQVSLGMAGARRILELINRETDL